MSSKSRTNMRLIHTNYTHTPQQDCRQSTYSSTNQSTTILHTDNNNNNNPASTNYYYFPITYTNDENIAYNWIHEHITAIIPSLSSSSTSLHHPPHSSMQTSSSSSTSTVSGVPSSLIPIGFDCEWQPTFDKGQEAVISVLQFATKHAALVFQINAFIPSSFSSVPLNIRSSESTSSSSSSSGNAAYHPNSFSSSVATEEAEGCLVRLLNNPYVLFIGMGINQDFRKVKDDVARLLRYNTTSTTSNSNTSSSSSSSFLTTSLCELKSFGRDRGINIKGGLLALTQYLDNSVAKWKTNSLQLSKWQRYPLREAEVRYAAMDAWSAILCYERLILLPIVPLPLPEEIRIDNTNSNSTGSNSNNNTPSMNTTITNTVNNSSNLFTVSSDTNYSISPILPVSTSVNPSSPNPKNRNTNHKSPHKKKNNYIDDGIPSPAQIALNMLKQAAVPQKNTGFTTETVRRNSKNSLNE